MTDCSDISELQEATGTPAANSTLRPMPEKPIFGRVEHRYREHPLRLSYWIRPAVEGGATLLYLHGLGSSKSDFLPAAREPALGRHTLVAFDFPGSGRSPYPEGLALGVDDLARLAAVVVDRLELGPITLVGHSLGGAVALLLAEQLGQRAVGLVNVEGNLTPEDCFLTRPLADLDWAAFSGGDFLDRLEARHAASSLLGDRTWADGFRVQVGPRAFYDYGRSLVALSEGGGLLERFLLLALDRAYVHGEANRGGLAHLGRLGEAGIDVVAVAGSGHWPLYDNPSAFLQALGRLLDPAARTPRTFDAHALARGVDEPWKNVHVCPVDGHVVRHSVLARDFHWHRHDSDEVLFVVEGTLAVDLEDRTESLGPGQGILLPAGTRHRTRGAPRAVNLAFEAADLDVRGSAAGADSLGLVDPLSAMEGCATGVHPPGPATSLSSSSVGAPTTESEP